MTCRISLADLEKKVAEMARRRDNGIDACTDDVIMIFDGYDTLYFRQACAYSEGLPQVTQIPAKPVIHK